MNNLSTIKIPHHNAVYEGVLLGRLPSLDGWDIDLAIQSQLNIFFDYYCSTLATDERAKAFIQKANIDDFNLLNDLGVGFSNRSLGKKLPNSDSAEGHYQRGRYQQIGFLTGSGREFFDGGLVFPFYDTSGNIVAAYGQRITPWLKAGTSYHLYWEHMEPGLFNRSVLGSSDSVILCKNPLEAVTLICAGFPNVVSTLGVRGFNTTQLCDLENAGIKDVTVAFDNNGTGNEAASLISQVLDASGIYCHQAVFPVGMDASQMLASRGLDVLRTAVLSAKELKPSCDYLLEGLNYVS
jgi:DNA primase